MFWYWRRRRLYCFYYQVEGHIGFGYKLELIGGGFIFHMVTSSRLNHRESPAVGSDDKEQSILSPSSSNKKTSSPAFMVTEKGAILSGQKVIDSLSVIFFIVFSFFASVMRRFFICILKSLLMLFWLLLVLRNLAIHYLLLIDLSLLLESKGVAKLPLIL
jgi:hypothetical protein